MKKIKILPVNLVVQRLCMLARVLGIGRKKQLAAVAIITFSILFSGLNALGQQKAHNPLIFADVPDMSMIRVGDTYYMSSTTMHFNPGVPIMKSKDLVNWKLVSYAYDTLADVDALNLANGKSTYGRGSWASSIRYHQGTYFVSTFAQTTGQTYIYRTKNIEKGQWKRVSFKPSYHDHSLFFDDDGKVYLLYGAGKLTLLELNADVSGVKEGGINQVAIENASAPSQVAGRKGGLGAEGSQLYKINGKYYLFNITWPPGGMRTVVIHRADKITGPWEGRIGLQDMGVAQGGLIDMPDGRWFAYLFRDFGAVGRIPYLVPVKWEDGWPVLGVNGKVPDTLDLPANKSLIPGIVASDEFTRTKKDAALPLVWQWNHNPDNSLWSVTERKGYLRLKTGRIDTSFLFARNSLTQRTIGPVCTGVTSLDITNMKDGDFAGLALLQKNYGIAGVRIDGNNRNIVMVNASTGKPEQVQSIPLKQQTVFFKAVCDFTNKKDTANFFFSLDGLSWTALGTPLKMAYTIPQFIGYRFTLFNYAERNIGGYADFDYFRITGTGDTDR
ncbi:MAG: glycoside hydrolase 43 family protein [Chitinophagaceae bacterium]